MQKNPVKPKSSQHTRLKIFNFQIKAEMFKKFESFQTSFLTVCAVAVVSKVLAHKLVNMLLVCNCM